MRVILCITNDIVTDQRVHRIAVSLKKIFESVTVVGAGFKNSMPLNKEFNTFRMCMVFNKGPFFYCEFNIRLFFYLLFKRAGVLVSNDLDTLPAVFLASKLKNSILLYDSHEYFTELPELIHRKHVKQIWEFIEKLFLPRVQHAYTVSESIAKSYDKKYKIQMSVIRNLPVRIENPVPVITVRRSHEKILIYQGALNIGRGLELAIHAMQFLPDTRLIIAGSGYIEKQLQELSKSLNLADKILFTGRLQPEILQNYTFQADLGLSLEEKTGLNYIYALPNKLFDYIQARIPVLVSDLPEMAAIVHGYKVGITTGVITPAELAEVIKEMLSDDLQRAQWKNNLELAAAELCWQNEELKLIDLYTRAIS